MRLNYFKSITTSWPQEKELVKYVYSMMCSQEDYQAGHMEHLYIVSYDPGLHYNPDAEAVMVDLNEPTNSDDLPELSESVS